VTDIQLFYKSMDCNELETYIKVDFFFFKLEFILIWNESWRTKKREQKHHSHFIFTRQGESESGGLHSALKSWVCLKACIPGLLHSPDLLLCFLARL